MAGAGKNERDWVQRQAKVAFFHSIFQMVVVALGIIAAMLAAVAYFGGFEQWRKGVDDAKNDIPTAIIERLSHMEGEVDAMRGNIDRLLDALIGWRKMRDTGETPKLWGPRRSLLTPDRRPPPTYPE